MVLQMVGDPNSPHGSEWRDFKRLEDPNSSPNWGPQLAPWLRVEGPKRLEDTNHPLNDWRPHQSLW